MKSVLLNLHDGLGDGWGWCRPFLYPAEEAGRLHVIPVGQPPLASTVLEETADRVRAWVLRTDVRHWQLIAILAVDGEAHSPQHGPLSGQIQQVLHRVVAPLQLQGRAPEVCWCIAFDRLQREDQSGVPRSPRAHALWQHDRQGWVQEGAEVPDGFCKAHIPEVFTRAEVDDVAAKGKQGQAEKLKTLLAQKEKALGAIPAGSAPAYTQGQLAALAEQLLALPARAQTPATALFTNILSVQALPASVRLLRLPGGMEHQAFLPCDVLRLVHLIQVLEREPHVASRFPQPQGSPFRVYVCTAYERDDPMLRQGLHRYTVNLQQSAQQLGLVHHTSMAFELLKSPSATTRLPELPLPGLLKAPWFHTPTFEGAWKAWLNSSQAQLVAQREAGRRVPGQHMKALQQAGQETETVQVGEQERIATGQDEDAPQLQPEPWSLQTFLDHLKRRYAEARAQLLHQPRPAFPDIHLGDELQALSTRLLVAYRRLPTRTRFWSVFFIVALFVLALPHALLLPATGTTWDYPALPLVLSGLLWAVAMITLYGLHRPIQRLLTDALETARRHGLRIQQSTEAHRTFVDTLFNVRLARHNLSRAQHEQRAREDQHLKDGYHSHVTAVYLENARELLRTCFPAPGASPAEEDGAPVPARHPEGPDLAFYAPETHAPYDAPSPSYTFTVDGASRPPPTTVWGLRRFAFVQDAGPDAFSSSRAHWHE